VIFWSVITENYHFDNLLTSLGGLCQLKTAEEGFQICGFIEQLGREVKVQSHSVKEFKRYIVREITEFVDKKRAI
jgi:hypothetical protein